MSTRHHPFGLILAAVTVALAAGILPGQQGTAPTSAGGAAPSPTVEIARDLSAFPAGQYELVRGFEEQRAWCVGDKPVGIQGERRRVTFDMTYVPPAKQDSGRAGAIECVLRRIEMDTHWDRDVMTPQGMIVSSETSNRQSAVYDSQAGPGGRGAGRDVSLGRLVGCISRAAIPDRRTLRGFEGISDRLAELHCENKMVLTLFSDYSLLGETFDSGAKFVDLPWLGALPRWGGEPLPMANDPLRRKFDLGQAWEVRRKMGSEDFRVYRCNLSELREGLAVVRVDWQDKFTRPEIEAGPYQPQETGIAVYQFHLPSSLIMGMDLSTWTTLSDKGPPREGTKPFPRTWFRRETMSLAAKSLRPTADKGDLEYVKTEITAVNEKQAVARAAFETARAHQWLTVTFQVWAKEGRILQTAGPDGVEQPLIVTWGDIFTPERGGCYRDVRAGIPMEKLKAVLNLPKGQATTVFVTCEVMEMDSKKYLGLGWPARCGLVLTTDGDGKVIKVEPVDNSPRDVRPR